MSAIDYCRLLDAYVVVCWEQYRTVSEVHEAIDAYMLELCSSK